MVYNSFSVNSDMDEHQLNTAHHYTQKALELHQNGDYKQAIFLLEDAGKIYQQYNKWLNYIETYNNIGHNYALLAQFELAIAYFNIAFMEGKKRLTTQHNEVARAAACLGVCHLYNNHYPKAIRYLQYALQSWSQQKQINCKSINYCYYYLGMVFFKQKQYNEALKYYQKILTHQIKFDNKADSAIAAKAYVAIGKTYFRQKAYQKAIAYLHKGLSIQLKVLGVLAMDTAKSYHTIGTCYAHTNDRQRAAAYQLKAQSIWSDLYQNRRSVFQYATQPHLQF